MGGEGPQIPRKAPHPNPLPWGEGIGWVPVQGVWGEAQSQSGVWGVMLPSQRQLGGLGVSPKTSISPPGEE